MPGPPLPLISFVSETAQVHLVPSKEGQIFCLVFYKPLPGCRRHPIPSLWQNVLEASKQGVLQLLEAQQRASGEQRRGAGTPLSVLWIPPLLPGPVPRARAQWAPVPASSGQAQPVTPVWAGSCRYPSICGSIAPLRRKYTLIKKGHHR